jgi:hypothetical protein
MKISKFELIKIKFVINVNLPEKVEKFKNKRKLNRNVAKFTKKECISKFLNFESQLKKKRIQKTNLKIEKQEILEKYNSSILQISFLEDGIARSEFLKNNAIKEKDQKMWEMEKLKKKNFDLRMEIEELEKEKSFLQRVINLSQK